MRLLDLFCGAGGAAKGYADAGFEVVGVDIEPQPNYPFEFVRADALTFPLDGFDAVHASAPCQAFTVYRNNSAHVRQDHPNLIPQTRERLIASGLPYVIENVPGAPLIDPIQLCGTSFPPLEVRRHRIFERRSASTPARRTGPTGGRSATSASGECPSSSSSEPSASTG
jgi:SAM-dependent methyltransferase